MPISITYVSSESASSYEVEVKLSSYDVISDPITYVSSSTIYTQILVDAGLPDDLYYIGASLVSVGKVGNLHIYNLKVQFSSTDGRAGGVGHTHNSNTVTFSLQDAYSDGSAILLSPSVGQIKLFANDDSSVDYFAISTDVATTERTLFAVNRESKIDIGCNIVYTEDNNYDLGTSDDGITKLRPRDVYIGRNAFIGGEIEASSLSISNAYEATDFGSGTVLGPTTDNWTLHRMVRVKISGVDTWICTYNHV